MDLPIPLTLLSLLQGLNKKGYTVTSFSGRINFFFFSSVGQWFSFGPVCRRHPVLHGVRTLK